MSRQGWVETLITAETAGANLTASNTATSLLPSGARAILPANWSDVGRQLRITASGVVGNIVTTPGTLTLDVRFGTIATPIVVFNGGAMQLNAVAKTTVTWWLDLILTVRAIGSGTAANVIGTGLWTSESVVGSAVPASGGAGSLSMPASSPAVGTGYDSTVSNAVDLFGTFSLNNANAIQLLQYTLQALN
jgi:hypothetical protein